MKYLVGFIGGFLFVVAIQGMAGSMLDLAGSMSAGQAAAKRENRSVVQKIEALEQRVTTLEKRQ